MKAQSLTLDTYASLDDGLKKCVCWEYLESKKSGDNLFDKESWIFNSILNWGTCGQIIEHDNYTAMTTYAPPRFYPKNETLVSGPVSSDAILISRVEFLKKVVDEKLYAEIIRESISTVLRDAVKRGIRAVEAFGVKNDTDPKEVKKLFSNCKCETACYFLENDLIDNGFSLVKDDELIPRYRIEVKPDLEWKSAVEYALDQLLIDIDIDERKIILV